MHSQGAPKKKKDVSTHTQEKKNCQENKDKHFQTPRATLATQHALKKKKEIKKLSLSYIYRLDVGACGLVKAQDARCLNISSLWNARTTLTRRVLL